MGWIKSERLAPQVIGLEGSNESWNDATVIRNVQCELDAMGGALQASPQALGELSQR